MGFKKKKKSIRPIYSVWRKKQRYVWKDQLLGCVLGGIRFLNFQKVGEPKSKKIVGRATRENLFFL